MLLGLIAGPAAAQSLNVYSATLNARAYEPMPANPSITVDVLDDTTFNLRIADDLARTLGGLGFANPNGAPLTLSLETLEERRTSPAGPLGEYRTEGDRDEVFRFNMWSARSDSVFNRAAPGQASSELVILATLRDEAARQRVWEIEIRAPARVRADRRALLRLIELFAQQTGKTVSRAQQSF